MIANEFRYDESNEKFDLKKIEKVEIRNIWENEGTEFTPWLAKEENIELLGSAIGIDLVVEAQEKRRWTI